MPRVESAYYLLLVTLARTTDTAVALPASLVRTDVSEGRLQRVDLTDLPEPVSQLGVITLRGRTLSPVARHAVELIVAMAAGLAAELAEVVARAKRSRAVPRGT